MKKMSLRWGLVSTVVICWLLPILIIVTLSGIMLNHNYQKSIRQEICAETESALKQVRMYLEEAIWDSKGVSYDGVVRDSYRQYLDNGSSVQLYRSVSSYLKQDFVGETGYDAVFLQFWQEGESASAYVLCRGTTSYGLLQQCRQDAPQLLEQMADADTDIRFFCMQGRLYMARNLVDQRFLPYATLVIVLDPEVIFQSLLSIGRVSSMDIALDGCAVMPAQQLGAGQKEIQDCLEVEGHTLVFSADAQDYSIWKDSPWLPGAVAGVALLVLPLLILMFSLFYRHVTFPMAILSEANDRMRAGERGYQISQTAPNAEFEQLYQNFNTMSTELKNQFERSYQEQRATQKAQIKALQSQINPHFLNNTLEIISWEARLANNTRVCAMIEALSTMLSAALDRDGRNQIPLSEELGYVEAYLYIIRERLGGALQVEQEIAPEMMEVPIPRLILQPIVENAVEHDITANRGGRLTLRARMDQGCIQLEVAHDGTMTDQDRENIRRLASSENPGKGRVGLRNVYRRLKLLYGDEGKLTIEEVTPGTILARLQFPQKYL